MMKDREVTIGLLNGVYKMLTEGDYDLLLENVCKLPEKLGDIMVRTFLSYGYLMPDKTIQVLLTAFSVYKNHYGKVTEDAQLEEIVKEAEEIRQKFTTPEEKAYGSRVLSVFIDEIELCYKESKSMQKTA